MKVEYDSNFQKWILKFKGKRPELFKWYELQTPTGRRLWRLSVTPEFKKWLEFNNVSGYQVRYYESGNMVRSFQHPDTLINQKWCMLTFEKSEDAMLFKLCWEGSLPND